MKLKDAKWGEHKEKLLKELEGIAAEWWVIAYMLAQPNG